MPKLTNTSTKSDAIIVGAGLAGLVAAAEILAAGKNIILVDQEPEAGIGGQAWWSFGGLFMINTPEQRRLGVKDSIELARQDWFGSAAFDREEDYWPKQWAEAYLHFADQEKRAWLRERGVKLFPIVGWAERGGYTAGGHGNSVPRFHITWGTGPGLVEPFEQQIRSAHAEGRVRFAFRHKVTELVLENGVVVGVRGNTLAESNTERGVQSNREVTGDFEFRAQAVVISTGGIGGNHEQVRKQWPARMGTPPKTLLSGVPAHVDGSGLQLTEAAGANLINGDRMWHYVEGIKNYAPVWPMHGIRILPGPSSLWFDATGKRLPVPLFPGFDTLGTLEYLCQSGYDHSWFVLNQSIIEKEFALSGSEQNPDLTGKSIRLLLQRLGKGAPAPVEAFKEKGEDFLVSDSLEDLLVQMQKLTPDVPIDTENIRHELEMRDREMDNAFTKDLQITALRGARNYKGDKLIRVASPHRILDPKHGPLIAVRLNILTRKSLGGIQSNLKGEVLGLNGEVIPGLYAAGEANGFGGGGIHGYRSLEGTFVGGCIFTGRTVGRSIVASL
ncbi:MAG: FAD-binding dehydrogenase [Microbacteriaceae bacterium]